MGFTVTSKVTGMDSAFAQLAALASPAAQTGHASRRDEGRAADRQIGQSQSAEEIEKAANDRPAETEHRREGQDDA